MLCVPDTAITYPTESQPRVGEGFHLVVVTPLPPHNQKTTLQPANIWRFQRAPWSSSRSSRESYRRK